MLLNKLDYQARKHITYNLCTDQDYEPAENNGPPFPQYGHQTAWAFLSLMGPWAPFPANGHVNAAVTRYFLVCKTKDKQQHQHACHMMEYEKCNICFTGKVWIPLAQFWLTDKFRMFRNDPEHCLKRISLIEDEDDILSNPSVFKF